MRNYVPKQAYKPLTRKNTKMPLLLLNAHSLKLTGKTSQETSGVLQHSGTKLTNRVYIHGLN
jgi:hypothetical protein